MMIMHSQISKMNEWVIDEEERPQKALEKETDLEEISDSKQEVVGVYRWWWWVVQLRSMRSSKRAEQSSSSSSSSWEGARERGLMSMQKTVGCRWGRLCGWVDNCE
jgi:hypothetical protein